MIKKILSKLFEKGWKRAVCITALVFVALVLVCVIFNFTLFRAKHVEVEFLGECEFSEQEVVIASSINNQTLLSLSKEWVKQNIEGEISFAKVEGVEIRFPNKVILHMSMRVPVFFVEDGGMFFVLDKHLKVLQILPSKPQDLIELAGIEPRSDEGEFCKTNAQNALFEIGNTQTTKLKSIKKLDIVCQTPEGNNKPIYTIVCTSINDVETRVYDVENSAVEKVDALFAVFDKQMQESGYYVVFVDHKGDVAVVWCNN